MIWSLRKPRARCPVVVGVDGPTSRTARSTVPPSSPPPGVGAAAGARLRRLPDRGAARELAARHGLAPPQARGLLDLAAGYARSRMALRAGEVRRAAPAPPAGVLREESRLASLVAVGSRRPAADGAAGRLRRRPPHAHADCAVLVVRGPDPRAPAPDAPVVVGVDGTPGSTAALRFAVAEAARAGCPLTVTAWDKTWVGGPETVAVLPPPAELQAEAARWPRSAGRRAATTPASASRGWSSTATRGRCCCGRRRGPARSSSGPAGGAASPGCSSARRARRCCTAARWTWRSSARTEPRRPPSLACGSRRAAANRLARERRSRPRRRRAAARQYTLTARNRCRWRPPGARGGEPQTAWSRPVHAAGLTRC